MPTPDQLKSAILAADKAGDTESAQRFAQMYHAATAAPAQPSWMDAIGQGISNLPNAAANFVGQAIAAPITGVAKAISDPQGTLNDVGNLANQAGNLIGGAVQRVRDLSPASEQGSAPRMDTTAFDQAAAAAKQNYGTEAGIKNTIANHPLIPAMAAAAVLHPTLNATGAYDALGSAASNIGSAAGDVGSAASSTIGGGFAKAGDIATSGTTLKNAGVAMKGQGSGLVSDALTSTSDQAAQATTQAQQLQAQADAVHPGDTAPSFQYQDTGPASLTDMGNMVRTPAFAQQNTLQTAMKTADAQYRSAMDAVASDKALAGSGVSDTPEAQALIANSNSIVNPDPVTRAVVGNVPVDSAGARLHKMLLDTLQPKEVPLSLDQADQAASQGIMVNEQPDGSYSRTVKPSLQNVDDFRRFLGKVIDGKVDGYEAINRGQAQQLYHGVSNAMDSYVDGASAPVQANWAAGKQALSPFENVRAGQSIVGMQDGTSVPSVPAAQIPGRMLSGGADTMAQTAAVAGQGPVTNVLASHLHNVFSGVDTADAASALVAPGTKLGDAVAANDPLQAAVSDYLNRFKAHEAATAQSQALSQQAASYSKTADALTGNVTKYQQQLDKLQSMPPSQVGPKYMEILDQANTDGTITRQQYQQGLQLAQTARTAMSNVATRNQWIMGAAQSVGLGGAGALGFSLFGH